MEPLVVPEFARLSDWAGLWAMEPMAFGVMVESLRRVDMKEHFRERPPELKSALEKIPAKGGQSIALIKVMGTMMKSQSSMGGASTVQLRRDIRQAAADSDVAGILLAIDSPGGTVAGTDDLAAEVKLARRTKPVVAHIDDLGASAAYWVASQAEQIFANSPTALVGSIGTFTTVYDTSAMYEAQGVKAYRFATGPLKGAGTSGTPITEEQRAYFQSLIDASQQHFDAAVKSGRKFSDKQLADVRSGAVFAAGDAIGRKLIDGIQPLSKTFDGMVKAIGGRMAESGLPMRQTLPMRI